MCEVRALTGHSGKKRLFNYKDSVLWCQNEPNCLSELGSELIMFRDGSLLRTEEREVICEKVVVALVL